MNADVIRDWTNSLVPGKSGDYRDVRYMVFRTGERMFQEIRDNDDNLIRTLELPEGLAIESSSFEVMLQYAMREAAA